MTVPISGYLGVLRFRVTADFGDDGFLYRYAQERREILLKEMNQRVTESVGTDYEIIGFEINEGSVVLTVILGTIGTTYVTLSQYEDFIKGITRLTSQLKHMFERFFASVPTGPPGIEVTVRESWEPSPAVSTAQHALMMEPRLDINASMVFYLIVSNAALLATLIWLLIRHSR